MRRARRRERRMLAEAIAKYKKAKKAVLDGFFEGGVNAALKGPEGNAAGAGTPLVQALDAAVCDVALAAREARDTGLPHTQAEIKRQFGLLEGSEGGKE